VDWCPYQWTNQGWCYRWWCLTSSFYDSYTFLLRMVKSIWQWNFSNSFFGTGDPQLFLTILPCRVTSLEGTTHAITTDISAIQW